MELGRKLTKNSDNLCSTDRTMVDVIARAEGLNGHIGGYRIRRCMPHYHTPLPRCSMVDISTVGIVSVPKRSALKTSRRELSEDVWFGIGTAGTLLVDEQSSSEERPKGVWNALRVCVIYTVVSGVRYHAINMLRSRPPRRTCSAYRPSSQPFSARNCRREN